MSAYDMKDINQSPNLRWLSIGALAGLLAAAYGLLEQQTPDALLPDDAAARVNGTLISRERYNRAISRSEASSGGDVSDATRASVLQRMIDEELLVQRGDELGMLESDNEVRAAIAQSLIASVTAEADAADPSDEELNLYLRENAARYVFANAVSVDAWTGEEERLTQQFAAELRDGNASDETDGIRRVPGLPSGALPIERLRMFLGPGITGSIATMDDGTIAVFARQNRWYIVRINDHEESILAELASIRPQVLIDYRRSLAETRLRKYIDELQSRADVDIAGP